MQPVIPKHGWRAPAIQLLLVPVVLWCCYLFQWYWLRFLTSDLYLRLSGLIGFDMARVSFDTIRWDHKLYTFTVGCTFINAFVVTIPLTWNTKICIWRNVTRFSGLFLVLVFVNLIRLEAETFLCGFGVSWGVADRIVGGITLGLFFVWILYRGGPIPLDLATGKEGLPWFKRPALLGICALIIGLNMTFWEM